MTKMGTGFISCARRYVIVIAILFLLVLSMPSHVSMAENPNLVLGAWLQGSMPSIYRTWVSKTQSSLSWFAAISIFGEPSTPVPNSGAPWITMTNILQGYRPYFDQGLFDGFVLTWDPKYSGSIPNSDSANAECLRRIGNGDYDVFIRANANWVKENVPYDLYIRFAPEMNNKGNAWSQDSVAYVDAWRRLHDVWSVTNPNTLFVWCPDWQGNPSTLHFQDYYPGDSYVDWIATDIFANSWGESASRMLNRGVYDFAVAHGKPFMIAEWGLNLTEDMTDQQNADWLAGMIDAVDSRPNIKAIIHWGQGEWFLLNYQNATQVYRNRFGPHFTLSADPSSVSVSAPSSGVARTYTSVSVSSVNGFSSAVSLSYYWVGSTPNGVSGMTLNPSKVTPSGSATLTFEVDSTASPGTFALRISGTDGSLTRTIDVPIAIAKATASTSTTVPTTVTSTKASTQTTTNSLQPFWGIPGFSIPSVITGILLAVAFLAIARRKKGKTSQLKRQCYPRLKIC